jgi:hypothetical protein
MLFRTLSMLISLTVTAAFFGWVKSSSKSPETTRLDEALSLSSLMPSKKPRVVRRHIAETTP